MAENSTGKAKEQKTSFFQGVKSEWKKIIWPTRNELGKQTLLVIVVSIILSLLITVVDSVALQIINLILGI